jgi:hypothetical protein
VQYNVHRRLHLVLRKECEAERERAFSTMEVVGCETAGSNKLSLFAAVLFPFSGAVGLWLFVAEVQLV